MKVIGIDLAGSQKNPTGFCILDVKRKVTHTQILYSDSEIVENVRRVKPQIVAIDAPLTLSTKNRKCDDALRNYGTLPLSLPAMRMLAQRGVKLVQKLGRFRVIEVFPTATAKILGLYSKDEGKVRENLANKGFIIKKELNKHELDALFAAITAYLHLEGKSEIIGDEEGKIVIPKPSLLLKKCPKTSPIF
jgi:hypothetical protein